MVHLSHRWPGHGADAGQCRRRRHRGPDGGGGRRVLVRPRPRLQPPLSRRRPRRAGDPDGEGPRCTPPGGRSLDAGAGLPAPLAAKRTAAAGWAGIHKMVGVPGSVGGGIVMNAGCHGAEWRDTVVSVLVMDASGHDRVVAAAEAGFSYRRSQLGHVVVLETTCALSAADPVHLEAETEELYKWRREGTPFNQPCCGSVFQNPVLPADWAEGNPRTSGQCIDATGLKGLRVGGVEVSPMHANYFVNTGDGTAADVIALMQQVRHRVRERWSVELVPEVKLIGTQGDVITLGR
ncbi:MAG: UDP-N-acetylmuramate dehydrogenase [Gemmatimonadetes bacterium]|nr:UDP-N-acetylmuramate dehydrogenase [Gemmatimonadota bacterium]